jgi:hypothetical protein
VRPFVAREWRGEPFASPSAEQIASASSGCFFPRVAKMFSSFALRLLVFAGCGLPSEPAPVVREEGNPGQKTWVSARISAFFPEAMRDFLARFAVAGIR